MKNKNIISYWNKYYNKKFSLHESSFARFILKYIKRKKQKVLLISDVAMEEIVYSFLKRV